VGLLDSKVELLDLSVSNYTDNGAKLGNAVKFSLDFLSTLLLVFGGILGVCLFLGAEPILVAATLELLGQMLGKYGGKRSQTVRGFDVSNNSDNNHRRSLNDRDGIDDFTLVHEGTRTVNATDNVGHTGLVSTERSQVAVLASIVLWEVTNATKVVLGTLLREESQVTMAGGFEFTVRHVGRIE